MAVYEHEEKFAAMLSDLVYQNLLVRPRIFTNTRELLRYIDEPARMPTIFLLDIVAPTGAGFGRTAAEHISFYGKDATIFVTGHDEKVVPVPRMHALSVAFVLKQGLDFDQRLAEALEQAAEKLAPSGKALHLSGVNEFYIIPATINYIVVSKTNYIHVHLVDGNVVQHYSSLRSVLQKLAWVKTFEFVHGSVIANLSNVMHIDRKAGLLHFHNGDTCLYSVVKLKKAIEKLGYGELWNSQH